MDARTRAAFAAQGFGVLTEIDLTVTIKTKLDVDLSAYRILSACNPKMALEAIKLELRVGSLLPCNVILREVPGGIEVSAVDPVASGQAISNPALQDVASHVGESWVKAVAAV